MKPPKIVYLIFALAVFNNCFGMNFPNENQSPWTKVKYENALQRVNYVIDAEKRLQRYQATKEEDFTFPETKEKFIAIEIENINTMKLNFTPFELKIYNELKNKS